MDFPRSVDLFCKVVDNFGDIGVCWRLARQLASQWQLGVRLWVDDLASFRWLCPTLDDSAAVQLQQGIEVRHWEDAFPDVVPHDLVIEAFACHLPQFFIEAMAARSARPVWINLEYLSAEDWVRSCHGMASPHPRLPLTKYFFFPGFVAGTGGLPCEHDLPQLRRQFQADPVAQSGFWQRLSVEPRQEHEIRVSLFAYENAAVASLLDAMAAASVPVTCLVPQSRVTHSVCQWLGQAELQPAAPVRRGALIVQALPFLPQPDYDRLLWACDVNFVRGEDSLARALWAARPCIWHIYPQDDAAHWPKLDALYDIYSAGLAPAAADAVRAMWHGWNHQTDVGASWDGWCQQRASIDSQAVEFARRLEAIGDLASNLLHFCRKIG